MNCWLLASYTVLWIDIVWYWPMRNGAVGQTGEPVLVPSMQSWRWEWHPSQHCTDRGRHSWILCGTSMKNACSASTMERWMVSQPERQSLFCKGRGGTGTLCVMWEWFLFPEYISDRSNMKMDKLWKKGSYGCMLVWISQVGRIFLRFLDTLDKFMSTWHKLKLFEGWEHQLKIPP